VANRNFVFLSDLHLSEGFLEDRRQYHENEDFFYDDVFARFLEHLDDAKIRKGLKYPWRLVVNGDFVDFLQVTTAPDPNNLEEVAAFRESVRVAAARDYADTDLKVGGKEYRLGLSFDAPKSVWKLARVVEGHPVFFKALAVFLAKGNDVVVVKGNHDAEFTYPEVRDYLRRIVDKYARPAEASKNLFFARWFYHEKGLFYAEHGGQYDDSNRYVFFLDPTMTLKGPEQPTLRFPFGSFFVRYFFNRIEASVPFADNLRPQTKALFWVITHKPWFALFELGTFLRFIGNFIQKKILSGFDQLALLDGLRGSPDVLARVAYFFLVPVFALIAASARAEYDKYKSRNFMRMLETEGYSGIIPENGAEPAATGITQLDMLKIYYRSFREGAFSEAREKELATALDKLNPVGKTESPFRGEREAGQLIRGVTATFGKAGERRPVVALGIFKAWRSALTLASAALTVWALSHWIFNVPGPGLILLGGGAAAFLLRGLGREILTRFYDVAPEHYLNKAAQGIVQILGVPHVIFGHTHVAYVHPLERKNDPGPAAQWEANTGSWTPVFDEEMMLRRVGDEFPFVQLITEGKGSANLELLRWNDELGEVQTVRYAGKF